MMRRCILVLVLGLGAFAGQGQNMDMDILKSINKHRNNSSEGIMEFMSNSDFPICLGVPVLQIATAYASSDRSIYQDGRQSLMSLGYALVVSELFQYAIDRPRPAKAYPLLINPYKSTAEPSFPSNHTSIAFSTATTLAICYPKWYVIAPAYLWAGTVGYSRMYLGMHYPSDVLFGAITGAGSAWISWKTNEWLKARTQSRTLMSY